MAGEFSNLTIGEEKMGTLRLDVPQRALVDFIRLLSYISHVRGFIYSMSLFRHHPTRLIRVVLPYLLIFVVAGCYPDHQQSTFDTTGPVAQSQLNLFYWIFWAAVFVFVLVEGALLYACLKFRRKPGDPDPEQTHGHTKLEITWTILPTILLVIVAVPTVLTVFDNANSPDPDSMHVTVVAHQWWWEFNYPGEGVKTSNELHIPIDEVINLSLESKDVLHSFWVPKIAGKVDMVPGNTNTMWIKGEEIGIFNGQCAEFCGESHANMRFRVIVESRADFNAWVVAEREPALVPVEPLAKAGLDLFEGDAQCWSCHKVEGSSRSKGTKGPNLTHLSSRQHLGAGIAENSQINLRNWLTNPNDMKPGNIMYRDAAVYNNPDKALSDSDISALVSYLRSLK